MGTAETDYVNLSQRTIVGEDFCFTAEFIATNAVNIRSK